MVNVVKCARNESTSVDSDDNVEIITSDWKIIEFVLNSVASIICNVREVFVQSLGDLKMLSAALVNRLPCNVVHKESRFISIKHLLKSISFIFLLATVLPPDCHWLCELRVCMWLSIASYFLICHHSHVLTTFHLSVRCQIRCWRINGRIIPFCCFFLLSGLKYRHYSAFSSCPNAIAVTGNVQLGTASRFSIWGKDTWEQSWCTRLVLFAVFTLSLTMSVSPPVAL